MLEQLILFVSLTVFEPREKVKAVINLESSFVSDSYIRFLGKLETERTIVIEIIRRWNR